MRQRTKSRAMRRKRGDWQRPVDDEILEFVADEVKATPQEVENAGVCSRGYASTRMSILVRAGLLRRITQGQYGVTTDGEAYLEGEFDASNVSPVGE